MADKPGNNDAGEKGNPFVMPPESELFTLRERQRRQAKEERAEQRKLKVHEKSTYSSRLNAKNASLRKTVNMYNRGIAPSSETQILDIYVLLGYPAHFSIIYISDNVTNGITRRKESTER